MAKEQKEKISKKDRKTIKARKKIYCPKCSHKVSLHHGVPVMPTDGRMMAVMMSGRPPELTGVCQKTLKTPGEDGYIHLTRCDCNLPPWDAELNANKKKNKKAGIVAPAREMMDSALGELKK